VRGQGEKNPCPWRESNACRPDRSLVAVLTELLPPPPLIKYQVLLFSGLKGTGCHGSVISTASYTGGVEFDSRLRSQNPV
jgi:hypothetical protein